MDDALRLERSHKTFAAALHIRTLNSAEKRIQSRANLYREAAKRYRINGTTQNLFLRYLHDESVLTSRLIGAAQTQKRFACVLRDSGHIQFVKTANSSPRTTPRLLGRYCTT